VRRDFAAQKLWMRHVRPEVLVSEPNGRSRLTIVKLPHSSMNDRQQVTP
jgi:hypothetical protein